MAFRLGHTKRSRRELSRRESSDMDEARMGELSEKTNQSKRKLAHVTESLRAVKLHKPFPAGIEPTFKV
jgi:hypothetical protein